MKEKEAKALCDSEFWKDLSVHDRVKFQLFEERLCMPFDVFHQAVEETLERSVWTHEFATPEHLRAEFLGEASAPTFEEILALIPTDKQYLLLVT